MIFQNIETSSYVFKKQINLLLWVQSMELSVHTLLQTGLIFKELKVERQIIASYQPVLAWEAALQISALFLAA